MSRFRKITNKMLKVSEKPKLNLGGAKLKLKKAGIYLKITDVPLETFIKIKRIFTIKIPSGIPALPPQKKALYQYAGERKYILLPRFGVFENFKNFRLVNKLDENDPKKYKWTGKLKPNQQIIFDHIMNKFYTEDIMDEGRAGLILKLGAGLGKSFVALALFVALGRKTLLVTHSTNMVYQWAELFAKFAPSIKVGYCYGKKKIDGDVVISIINTIAGANFKLGDKTYEKSEFFEMFDFVICDECQLMLSPSGERMYRRFQSPYMLGLSATPSENAQGKDCIAWWNIGPVLDAEEIPGYKKSEVKFTGSVKMIKYNGPHEFTKLIINERMGVTAVPQMITQMMGDPYRVHLIAVEAKRLQELGLKLFIFADRRKYLLDIKERMVFIGVKCFLMEDKSKKKMRRVKNKDGIVRLVGGSTAEDMKIAEAKSDVILTTYQYMSVGKSIPKMNAIILASPRKNYNEQTIKRIFRLGSDASIERQIIDIVDWKTPMKTQWYSRRKYFKSQEYPIDQVEVNWGDFAKIAGGGTKKEERSLNELASKLFE